MQSTKTKLPATPSGPGAARCILYFAFCIFFSLPGFAQRNVTDHAKSVISPRLIKQTVGYLASDSMKGRGTNSPELNTAAEYIAGQFKLYGLQSFHGSYFQELNFCYFDLGADNFISVIKGLETINFKLKDDFVPYDISGNRPAEGDIVFAGYGITAVEYNYDDYKDLDVKGKIVVVLKQEPGQADSSQVLFGGTELSPYSEVKEKQKNAMAHGAAGLLVMPGTLNYISLKPKGFSWPALSKSLPKDALPKGYCGRPEEFIPVAEIGESLIIELFGSVDSLKHIQQRIDKKMKPASYPIKGKTMAVNMSIVSRPVGGRNVIAWLEGSDPVLKEEAVIVGGHYDHIGFSKEPSGEPDYIYNGADDNASGTSGVLAIAKAFASMKETPRRSVIFIAFAGEEEGLLGSESYVRKPFWPISKTVAMLNLDMIGRNNPDSLKIIGARQNPGLMAIVRKQNANVGFTLAESTSIRMDGGSDHASFFKKGIPSIFFFTGFHEDYHKVSDNPDKINTVKVARISMLAYLTAWTIANESRRYRIINQKMNDE
jgi:hypothetical protein